MRDMNNPADSSVKGRAIIEGCEAGNSKLDDQVALNELSYGEQYPDTGNPFDSDCGELDDYVDAGYGDYIFTAAYVNSVLKVLAEMHKNLGTVDVEIGVRYGGEAVGIWVDGMCRIYHGTNTFTDEQFAELKSIGFDSISPNNTRRHSKADVRRLKRANSGVYRVLSSFKKKLKD